MKHEHDQFTFGRSVLIDTAAAVLGVSRRTVYYRISAGRLQTVRTRNGSQRVLWESLEALRRESESSPGPSADAEAGLPVAFSTVGAATASLPESAAL